MRTRYYSPDAIKILGEQNDTQKKKLNSIASMKQLQPFYTNREQLIFTIGKYTYQTNRLLGMGYSSKVYIGRSIDPLEKQQYAIKVIDINHFTKANSISNIDMLHNQITILKKMDHPNIIKCYDVYKNDSYCYIVTELCKEGDLSKFINYNKNNGKLDQQTVRDIMKSIIEGYKYMIKKGVLHRDLKPANIMKGKDNLWKIGDFGFALESQTEIKSSFNVGTPLYMPPQSLIKNYYSPKTDIFSIGIIYYQLLFGQTPWECKTQKQLIKKITTIPLKIPNKPQISHQLIKLIEKMCEIDPNKRMPKQQFLFINVNTNNINPQQIEQDDKYSLKIKKVSSLKQFRPSSMEIHKINSIQTNSTEEQQYNKPNQEKLQNKNNNIILCQLNYCRFLYYIIKNSYYYCVSPKTKDKISLIAFKHLIKIIKQLSDENKNWFNLENWKTFTNSKKYLNTLKTVKQYCQRYEKQYLAYLKKTDILIIRQVNQSFQQFVGIDSFSVNFYRDVQNKLIQFIRQYNHNLAVLLSRYSFKLNEQLKSSICGLKCILKYKQVLQILYNHYQNYDYFEKKSDIKVYVDYRKQNNCRYDDYVLLRNQIKYI